MSKDVTNLFETYRESARHLRNTYFSTRDSKNWNTIEDFNEVAKVLFARLVLYRLADNYDRTIDRAVEDRRLLIVPDAERMPLMISREKNGGGYWDHPIEVLQRGEAKIAFKAYFDWDQHGLIDFRYYHGVILGSVAHPEVVDHEVLIETIYGRILFESAPGN
jgi:hypothetical protein